MTPLDDLSVMTEYAYGRGWSPALNEQRMKQFSEWLESARAEAWHRGYWAANQDWDDGISTRTRNPYRKEAL